jgi:hypothetical protein
MIPVDPIVRWTVASWLLAIVVLLVRVVAINLREARERSPGAPSFRPFAVAAAVGMFGAVVGFVIPLLR